MSYDIYGNNLRRGYCEVHPHVGEEYPCSLCMVEADRERSRQQECDEHYRTIEAAAFAQQFAEAEYQSWL